MKRWILSAVIGALIAALLGGTGWAAASTAPELTGALIAATTFPVAVVFVWVLLVADPATGNTKESHTSQRRLEIAMGGAAKDLLVTAGLALIAVSVLRLEVPAQLLLTGMLALLGVATAIRYVSTNAASAEPGDSAADG